MLNTTTLESFMVSFLGYGNLNAKTYFIGMEEGGGNSELEVQKRLLAWEKMGSITTVNLASYSTRIGYGDFFTERNKSQPTWNKLIRVLLSMQGTSGLTLSKVKKYQRDQLGRLDSNHALLELMPLPSPSLDHWIYKDNFDLGLLS